MVDDVRYTFEGVIADDENVIPEYIEEAAAKASVGIKDDWVKRLSHPNNVTVEISGGLRSGETMRGNQCQDPDFNFMEFDYSHFDFISYDKSTALYEIDAKNEMVPHPPLPTDEYSPESAVGIYTRTRVINRGDRPLYVARDAHREEARTQFKDALQKEVAFHRDVDLEDDVFETIDLTP